MEWVEGMDPDEPGVRRVPWSSVGENPPEVRAHIARKEAIRERKANRREVHPRRKPPLEDEGLLVEPSERYPFSLDDVWVLLRHDQRFLLCMVLGVLGSRALVLDHHPAKGPHKGKVGSCN